MNERIAFVGWNPFQFRHIENISDRLPGSFYIVEKRKENIGQFEESFFKKRDKNIIIWPSAEIYKLDGIFEHFVCQVPFPGIEKIIKSKIAFVQYGYAKDPHNYGVWRAFADVNFTYGKYSTDRISTYTDCVETGNPESEKWLSENFHKLAKEKFSQILDGRKKTILYAPTWGDLSSVDLYADKIIDTLSSKYNIILKLHHNTDLIEKNRQKLKNIRGVHIAGANDDIWELFCVSDILISDYSGAIFDGVYAEKPIVLLNIEGAIKSKKEDLNSLEMSLRNEIGCQIDNFNELSNFEYIIAESERIRNRYKVKGKLFSDEKIPSKLIANELLLRISQPRQKSQIQKYINDYLRTTYLNSKLKK